MPPNKKKAAMPDIADSINYKEAWLTPAKKRGKMAVPDTDGMKLWYNEAKNPTTQELTGSWMLFVQTVDKEPDANVLEIVERYSLIEEVRTSKANQYYFKIHADRQTGHIVAELQQAGYKIALPVGKQEDFIARGQSAFLDVRSDDDTLKITGHVEPVAHLLVLETIGAEAVEATAYERKYYTIDKPTTNAAVRAKVLIVKNLAEFWGFGFQTDLL